MKDETGNDGRLLRRYAREDSQAAFAELVRRYIGLVYATCLRETQDAQLAEEGTQTVFLLLARKARALAGRRDLSGWLFHAARLSAKDLRKREGRRQRREDAAAQQMAEEADARGREEALRADLAPRLNAALAALPARERDAILQRILLGKSFRETGEALGVSEDAARMRVSRALEHLRAHLGGAGLPVTLGALSAALTVKTAETVSASCLDAALGLAAGQGIGGIAGLEILRTTERVWRTFIMAKVKGTAAAVGACALAGLLIKGGSVAVAQIQAIPPRDGTTQAPAVTPAVSGWKLTFDEEFSGDRLDPTAWVAEDHPCDANNALEYDSPDAVTVQNGYARLTSSQQAKGGKPYTSADLDTETKFAQLYGRFEMRTRLPRTSGSWVRNCLNPESDAWPPALNFIQYYGSNPRQLQMNAFSVGPDGNMKMAAGNWAFPETFDPTDWHTYTVEWEPGGMRWLIDGQPRAFAPGNTPQEPLYVDLMTSVGGDYAGDPSPGTWPQYQDIDYVRVYRRADQPPPVCAGPDQRTALPQATVTLAGYTCHPQGDVVTTWSKDSGPGAVTFTDPHAVQTTATFTQPGRYILALTAKDGGAVGTDYVKVVVDGPNDVRLPCVADASVGTSASDPHQATTNFGDSHDLWVRTGSPGMGGKQETDIAYLRFDITQMPANGTARLWLYGGPEHGNEKAVGPVSVSGVADLSWGENAVTWENRPDLGARIGALDIRSNLHYPQKRWYSVDVTDYVKAQRRAGKMQAAFALSVPARATQVLYQFRSRESHNPAHPLLVVSP